MIATVGQELPVEDDRASRGLSADVDAAEIIQQNISADGFHFDTTRAAEALERPSDGGNGHITGGVRHADTCLDGFNAHVAADVGDADGTGVVMNLQLGIFRNVHLKISLK